MPTNSFPHLDAKTGFATIELSNITRQRREYLLKSALRKPNFGV